MFASGIEYAGPMFDLDLSGYSQAVAMNSDIGEIADDITLDNYDRLKWIAHSPWARLTMSLGQSVLLVDAVNRAKKRVRESPDLGVEETKDEEKMVLVEEEGPSLKKVKVEQPSQSLTQLAKSKKAEPSAKRRKFDLL